MSTPSPGLGVSRKRAEIAFALLLAAFGGVILVGARELETGWGSSGPEAGYFPFRLGWLIVAVSAAILISEAVKSASPSVSTIDRQGAQNMLFFALPLIGLVLLIPSLGIYLSAAIYLAFAVGVIGKAGWKTAFLTAVGAPTFLFLLFEFVFRTPLPKGPLGPLFGML
jgi:putative tricarboxylic transport membrane protein